MGFKNYIIQYIAFMYISSKAGFFSKLKTRQSDSPQTSNLTFLAELSVVSQLKNTVVGPMKSVSHCSESGHNMYLLYICKLKSGQAAFLLRMML